MLPLVASVALLGMEEHYLAFSPSATTDDSDEGLSCTAYACLDSDLESRALRREKAHGTDSTGWNFCSASKRLIILGAVLTVWSRSSLQNLSCETLITAQKDAENSQSGCVDVDPIGRDRSKDVNKACSSLIGLNQGDGLSAISGDWAWCVQTVAPVQ